MAAPESIDLAACSTPCLRSFALSGDHETGRGIQDRDVAERTLGALEHVDQRLRVLLGVAAAQRFRLLAGEADLLGRDLERAHRAFLQRGDEGRPGDRDLVEAVGAVHHPDAFRAEVLQHLRQRLDPLAREHADHLPPHAGGIGQRTEQVEDRAGAELDAGRADILHRRMVRRREHEADAGFLDAAPDDVRRQFDLHAQRASTSAAPEREERARLPCLATGTPAPATMKAAQVEML